MPSLEKRLRDNILKLAQFGHHNGNGITRPVFSPPEAEARKFIINLMREVGLQVRFDQAGNIIGKLRGHDADSPAVATGSHVDTVPNGGMFDGALGVLAGVEVARLMREHGIRTRNSVEVIVFANEEGVRYPPHSGSRSMAGLVDNDTLLSWRDSKGISYAEAMRSIGLNPSTLSPPERKKNEFGAWVELHIEQGPVLESRKTEIGVVTNINGLLHLMLEIEGRPGHAGTTPMSSRSDPMLHAAHAIIDINRIAREGGNSLVGTVGFLEAQPGALNVIPQKVRCGVDVRASSSATMNSAFERIRECVKERSEIIGTRFKIEKIAKISPTRLSGSVIDVISESAKSLDLSSFKMPSGAGHDTQNMARLTRTGMIFVPSHKGLSHVPQEWTNWSDLRKGCELLFDAITKLAN